MTYIKTCVRLICFIGLAVMTRASNIDIFTAIEQQNLEAVKELVQENPQIVNAVDNGGYSPLHKAAYNGLLEIAKYLLSQGADINAASASGSTPLHGAAFYGHPDMVRFLLDNG
ncbi:MAG: ankyrin repeat domain-containing protein, partial [Candidatus Zixiibacteriota bacterium]